MKNPKSLPHKIRNQAPDKSLDDLILEGINITRMAQEGDALYSDNQFIAVNAHNKFAIWREEIKELFVREGFDSSDHPQWPLMARLYVSDSVPHFKGGIEYGDPSSDKSQTLLRNIREETTRKLETLQQVRAALEKGKRNSSEWENASKTDITITADKLMWRGKSIPLERGQRRVFEILFKPAQIFRNGRLVKKGGSVNRKVLEKQGMYKDEESFRNALNHLRRKLKKSKFPVDITNPTTNHYLMMLKYNLE